MSLISWQIDVAHQAVPIDLSIYSQQAVIRAAYKLTDRAFILLKREDSSQPGSITAFLMGRTAQADLKPVVLEFMNELIDQQLRVQLESQFGDVRTLIVAQAFAEGNLLSPDDEGADNRADPQEARRRR